MIVYRLAKEHFRNDLSGKGAEIAGGRWNNKGIALLYTATNRSLCMAEVLVHQPLGKLPKDFWLLSIDVPDDCPLQTLASDKLPDNWNTLPHSPESRIIGDRFVSEGKFIGLLLPSAVVQGDQNLLLNPGHSDFPRVKIVEIEPFVFDPRFFGR